MYVTFKQIVIIQFCFFVFLLNIHLIRFSLMKKKSETIELRENITRFIAEKLSVYGFKRRKDIFIYRKHNNDILQQFICSGNIDKIDRIVKYSIGIWLEYTKLGQLIQEQFNIDPTSITIVKCNIGHLMPINTYTEWEFKVDEDYTSKAEELVEYIIQYGFPFLYSLSEKKHMIDSIKGNPIILTDTQAYLLPLIYYLNDNKEKALEILHTSILLYQKHFKSYCNALKNYNSYTDEDIKKLEDIDLK